MGAGEVGCFLARRFSAEGHGVTMIDPDPSKQRVVEEQLDVSFVLGNGSQIPSLMNAGAGTCDLFVAASSSDEANLAASLLAKRLGASRTVVRVNVSEDITKFGRVYERAFAADLLLSTQLLTTTLILNRVLGYNTLEIEYVASGDLEVRRIAITAGSRLIDRPLAEAQLPNDCLVLAFVAEGVVRVPSGRDHARLGEEALVIGTPAALDELERWLNHVPDRRGYVVIAGGGNTALAVIESLAGQVGRIKVFERDRTRAEQLAEAQRRVEVVHGDVTDAALLASERISEATAFVALTGNDETNLMACLLAKEQGVPQLTALAQKSETSSLWSTIEGLEVVSPRIVAAERIQHYVETDFEPHIVSFENGAAQFIQRTIHPQSPAAGVGLEEIEAPAGLLVAAILREGEARIPRGKDRVHAGDVVVLFVQQSQIALARLLFPDQEEELES